MSLWKSQSVPTTLFYQFDCQAVATQLQEFLSNPEQKISQDKQEIQYIVRYIHESNEQTDLDYCHNRGAVVLIIIWHLMSAHTGLILDKHMALSVNHGTVAMAVKCFARQWPV